METVGIHHVALNVRNLGDALTFYEGALGFTLMPRPDFGFDGAWLQVGASQVHLIEVDDAHPDARQHFALQVADLDATVAALEEKGLTVRRAAHVVGAGRQAFIRDPSGNRIELNQPDGLAPGG
jgi:catechol 2,3-dioxygenase-like lactoylglutathione lyase family enzyme